MNLGIFSCSFFQGAPHLTVGTQITMYVVFPDGEIDDQDMEQLQELLAVIDHQYTFNLEKRKRTAPPEQNIYWDRLSYLAGLGFVMCQQYINITYPTAEFKRNKALELPPMHPSGYSVAYLINTGANYWKHYQEEINFPYGDLNKSTIQTIEKVGLSIESPYVCEGVLDRIVDTDKEPFQALINTLVEWRDNLIKGANKCV